MQNYHPPEYKKLQFHCIHCGVYSEQSWQNFYCWNRFHGGYSIHAPLEFCVCEHCKKWSYWYDGRLIVPSVALVPAAHVDIPPECAADYNEARSIVELSPRAASALLRLSLQKLMIALGESGKNINEDIDSLFEKGLPVEVRQALDSCHIEENNAVKPGEIEINGSAEVACSLFNIINFIIEDRISRPMQIQSLFAEIPESVKNAVERRDEHDT
ncbi:MAG TPA: DUF4145 domain-containing protein [Methylobacter sp.]|jgi:hypothetical protein